MIPESIKKLAQKVRTEIYGRDVRESIAKSMEVSGETSNEANERSKDTDARQTDVENRFDDQIAGNTDIDEVIDARRPEGGEAYPTLRKRLDDEHKEITTQLAHIAINVKKFGAKGDGVTDDTESIQNAIDHVLDNGGGTVLIPNGRYRISGYIEYGSNMRLLGSGRATVIDGVEGTGVATIRPKQELRGSKEIYDGATDFSLENFAFDSSDLSRQGIYTDNCSRFKIKNFWGLNTAMHYLDINNSIHGRIENVYLHKNVESRGALQIDSLEGINKHIQMDNVLVYSEEGTEHSGITMHDCAVHLHRDGGEFIDLDGLTVVNVPVGIYTDTSYVLNNSSLKNLKFVNVQRPIHHLGSPDAQSNNLTFDYINIVGEHVDRGLLFSDVNKLKISNVNVKVDVSTETHLIRLARSSEVKIGAIDIEGGLKQTNPSHPLYFLSVYQTPDFEFLEKISGEFVPRVVKMNKPSEQVDYTTRTGHYTILGKEISVKWHTIISHDGTGGDVGFTDLPASISPNKNLISSFGSIGILKGLKDNLPLRILKPNGVVILSKDAMTGSILQFSDLDTTKDFEISFEITYKFYLPPS